MTIREKAEALVDSYEHMQAILPSIAGGEDSLSHSIDVCRAYLAEHPIDDDEPVTEEWLRTIGGYDICHNGNAYWIVIDILEFSIPRQEFRIPGPTWLPHIKTRGDVRRLCKALGIELKGGSR